MGATDPFADGLTKIRNASRAGHPSTDVKPSRLMSQVLEVLKREGFVRAYTAAGQTPAQRVLRVYLKYVKTRPVISELIRVSKPGVRMYRKARELPRVLGGLGVAIITTSDGVMTEQEAYRKRVGGEVLCYVW